MLIKEITTKLKTLSAVLPGEHLLAYDWVTYAKVQFFVLLALVKRNNNYKIINKINNTIMEVKQI